MRVGPNWYGSFCKRNMNFTKIGILLDSKFKKLNSQDEFKDLQRTSEYDGQTKMADTNLSKNVHYGSLGKKFSGLISWDHGHKLIIYSQSYSRI